MNGDDLYSPSDLKRMAQASPALLAKEVDNPRLYGICELNAEGNLKQLVEKPHTPASNLANIGVYKLPQDFFGYLEELTPSERGEIEITSAIAAYCQNNPFKVLPTEDYWFPIVYPWNMLEPNLYFLQHHLEEKNEADVHALSSITGPVSIGKGTRVGPGAVIEGPVIIGEHCDIGPNCWIRPGTSLGDGCKVGQASEIKNSIFFEKARAPHQNYIGDSIIGEDANLGCGTITANLRHDNLNIRSMVKDKLIDTGLRKLGAILGDHVHTGINTSIYPGRKMWPGTGTLPGDIVNRDRTE
jgi:bifunctional UDP-N-acetylglucosamine pyrophosphorylase/glucosamine-1-phosphate N-acetyltransferase